MPHVCIGELGPDPLRTDYRAARQLPRRGSRVRVPVSSTSSARFVSRRRLAAALGALGQAPQVTQVTVPPQAVSSGSQKISVTVTHRTPPRPAPSVTVPPSKPTPPAPIVLVQDRPQATPQEEGPSRWMEFALAVAGFLVAAWGGLGS
jgi:hypothetical protein